MYKVLAQRTLQILIQDQVQAPAVVQVLVQVLVQVAAADRQAAAEDIATNVL